MKDAYQKAKKELPKGTVQVEQTQKSKSPMSHSQPEARSETPTSLVSTSSTHPKKEKAKETAPALEHSLSKQLDADMKKMLQVKKVLRMEKAAVKKKTLKKQKIPKKQKSPKKKGTQKPVPKKTMQTVVKPRATQSAVLNTKHVKRKVQSMKRKMQHRLANPFDYAAVHDMEIKRQGLRKKVILLASKLANLKKKAENEKTQAKLAAEKADAKAKLHREKDAKEDAEELASLPPKVAQKLRAIQEQMMSEKVSKWQREHQAELEVQSRLSATRVKRDEAKVQQIQHKLALETSNVMAESQKQSGGVDGISMEQLDTPSFNGAQVKQVSDWVETLAREVSAVAKEEQDADKLMTLQQNMAVRAVDNAVQKEVARVMKSGALDARK